MNNTASSFWHSTMNGAQFKQRQQKIITAKPGEK